MKSKFPEYYRIHKEDLLAHFDECIFIFDACALLDIYRLKMELAEDVFKVLEHLKEQIRIPYHVAEEYTKNIHEVLNKQLQTIKDSRSNFDSIVKAFESKRSHPYLSKNSTDLISKLKRQVEKDFKEQEDYIKDQLIHGNYQNRMAEILDGKVLEPFSAEEILSIQTEGATRYENKIPPGYKDANKSDNRYGDLINWKEILRYAKECGKHIIIVSSEIKEDWVTKEQGQIVGLRYELIKEFYNEVGNSDQYVHFFSLDRFLEFAREKDEQVVTQETVDEVKDYVVLPHVDKKSYWSDIEKIALDNQKYLFTDDYIKKIKENYHTYQSALDSWKTLLKDKEDIKTLSDYIEDINKKSFYLIKNKEDFKATPMDYNDITDKITDDDESVKCQDDKSVDSSEE